MSFNTNPYGTGIAIQNDRQLYHDFLANQKRMRENYAGAASNNNISQMHYGNSPGSDKKFQKHQPTTYSPNENKFNIYERKGTRAIPKTRDRFIANAFSQLIAPQIKEAKPDRFAHDKLNVTDIMGANPDTYGKFRRLEGRDIMD